MGAAGHHQAFMVISAGWVSSSNIFHEAENNIFHFVAFFWGSQESNSFFQAACNCHRASPQNPVTPALLIQKKEGSMKWNVQSDTFNPFSS